MSPPHDQRCNTPHATAHEIALPKPSCTSLAAAWIQGVADGSGLLAMNRSIARLKQSMPSDHHMRLSLRRASPNIDAVTSVVLKGVKMALSPPS
ncbi:Os08g0562001 [Oryza sativa Japonica Group]|uniref:Os08g0562001 protein n=1 Tax=Oryza sativa subsp. japonica TaxID=39947 RepID=A0A0P0XIA4_ORYSJ|nr:Os08g0562001 [Oryza sativa Japonica Group]